jgi:hypothetical protein
MKWADIPGVFLVEQLHHPAIPCRQGVKGEHSFARIVLDAVGIGRG